jgi:hypothetical protein
VKRKFLMLGFAMLTGLPHAVCAKGFGKEDGAVSYTAWNTPYSPHYGSEGEVYPLMDHLSANIARHAAGNWKIELSPPRIDQADQENPIHGKDKRIGVSFKLSF